MGKILPLELPLQGMWVWSLFREVPRAARYSQKKKKNKPGTQNSPFGQDGLCGELGGENEPSTQWE